MEAGTLIRIPIIIAGIIAGILLGAILGYALPSLLIQSSQGGYHPPAPKNILQSGLKEIQSKGYGVTTPQKVTFAKGSTISVDNLIEDMPIRSADMTFICNSPNLCGLGNPLSIADSGKRLDATINIEAYAVMCGNDGRLSGPKYCIALSDTAQAATEDCTGPDGCGLE